MSIAYIQAHKVHLYITTKYLISVHVQKDYASLGYDGKNVNDIMCIISICVCVIHSLPEA